MNVDVRPDVRVNFDGVKTVVSEVVAAQRQGNFAGDDGVPFLGVEANIEVGIFQNVNRLIGLNLSETNVAHADANAAFVIPALRIGIGFWIVV